MNRSIMHLLVVMLATSAGCSEQTSAREGGGKKVSEQILVNYTPLRRISYRDTCGESRLLRVCVERITLSETAALLELRVTNRSAVPYLPGKSGEQPSVQLASSSGALLSGTIAHLGTVPSAGEKYLYCSIDGQMSGELKTVSWMEASAGQQPMNEPWENIVIDLGG